MLKAFSLSSLALLIGLNAGAEDSAGGDATSLLKIEDVRGDQNKVSGDIDEEITNKKLRAESGSKSKWSISVTPNYQGASIEKPLHKDRPNLMRDPVPQKVRLEGELAVRFRLTKNDSIKLGSVFGLQRPLQDAKRGDIADPYVKYSRVSKVGSYFQSVFEAGPSLGTSGDRIATGEFLRPELSEIMLTDFGGTRLTGGLAGDLTYSFFSKDGEMIQPKGTSAAAPANQFQQDYQVALFPFFEYALSDRVQLRTVFRPYVFAHDRNAAWSTLQKRPWTQSVGVVVGLTRDVSLYPNFQFDWEQWRRDDFNFLRKGVRSSSTVALSAAINLF